MISTLTKAFSDATSKLGEAAKETAKSKSADGMPVLTKWDGNAKTWYGWKDSFMNRASRKGLKPPKAEDVANGTATNLSDENEVAVVIRMIRVFGLLSVFVL